MTDRRKCLESGLRETDVPLQPPGAIWHPAGGNRLGVSACRRYRLGRNRESAGAPARGRVPVWMEAVPKIVPYLVPEESFFLVPAPFSPLARGMIFRDGTVDAGASAVLDDGPQSRPGNQP